jgi:threonylcarbamoyladenosine tRNA methylthiotransferase MtaB
MNRRYTTGEFAALVAAAREAIPDLAVTSDVIVGFPGETEGAFAASLDFVSNMAFARTHVFPYSRRSGTPAAEMPGQIPTSIRRERARAMRAVATASQQAFARQFVGQSVQVLWESSRQGGEGSLRQWRGLTDNYLRVHTQSAENLANTNRSVRIVALDEKGLRGQLEI